MTISDTLRVLYTAEIEQRDDGYYLEVPEAEVDAGTVDADTTHRVAVLSTPSTDGESTDAAARTTTDFHSSHPSQPSSPPVSNGDIRDVEIENIGDQGDGIAKIDRGYVVIVPNTTVGEQVSIEIQQARENVAFADVVDRSSH